MRMKEQELGIEAEGNNRQKSLFIRKEWFIQSSNAAILNKYAFGKILGEGAFGCVYKATLIGTDFTRAIKVIQKDKVAEPIRMLNEINLMKQLDHPNLVKLYETYESANEIFMVMQYCEGGELFSRIENGRKMSQKTAKVVFRDIVKVINYLHTNNVCHRDLKPENFIFLDRSPDSLIKLTDFGLSTTIKQPSLRLKSFVGTVYYISPEVLESSYDISCDIWSLGVILIVLLTGSAPVEGQSDAEILSNIRRNKVLIPDEVSITAKNLIRKCLLPSHKRINAAQILEHPWLIDRDKKRIINAKMDFRMLQKFSCSSALKKIVLTIIASQVKSKQIEQITKLFKSLDANSDGVLSVGEIIGSLKTSQICSYSHEEVMKTIAGLDTDKNGEISYTEFLAAMMDKSIYLKPKNLKLAFDIIDKDSSGTLQLEELKMLMMPDDDQVDEMSNRNKLKQQEWEEILSSVDLDGDGKISFQEFLKFFEL